MEAVLETAQRQKMGPAIMGKAELVSGWGWLWVEVVMVDGLGKTRGACFPPPIIQMYA